MNKSFTFVFLWISFLILCFSFENRGKANEVVTKVEQPEVRDNIVEIFDESHVDEDHIDEDHSDEDHSDEDHSDEDHSDEDHGDEDHSDEDHSDEDHSDEDHGDEDHSDEDHSDEDHSDEDHGDEDHSDEDHTDEDHSDEDHSDEDHGDEDHSDEDHGDEDHSDEDHSDEDHSDEDHGDEDHSDEDHEDHDHGDEDLFQKLILLSGSNDKMGLDISAVRWILSELNENCITAENFLNSSSVVNEAQFNVILRKIIQNLQIRSDEDCSGSDIQKTAICLSNMNEILQKISTSGKISSDPSKKCFSSTDLLEKKCLNTTEEINKSFLQLVVKLLEKSCILPTSQETVEEIFSMYNTTDQLTEPELSQLLKDLSIGNQGTTPDEDDHDDHDHSRRKRSEEEDHEALLSEKCYSSEEYVSIALNELGSDSEPKVISKKGFFEICPVLIQQVLSDACSPKTKANHQEPDSMYTTAQKYGYGTASVFIISLLAFVGLTVFKGVDKNSFKLLMQFFIALGIGTLSGDALLHLLPQVLGLHNHSTGEHEDHEDHEEEDKMYVWKLLVVVSGIYIFFLFENILKLWNQLSDSKIAFHRHPDDDTLNGDGLDDNHSGIKTHRITCFSVIANPNPKLGDEDLENGEVQAEKHPNMNQNSNNNTDTKQPFFWGITAVGCMVWIGDALHNFGDGIALGAAFSTSWVSGVGTSFAIFCHELPHEFGDFAIYLQNGMSKWKALLMNFLAACFAFIGLYVGLTIAEQGDAQQWLLAVIAGMFLYISLVDVMHEMIGEKTSQPILQFVVQNLGLFLGWAIMLLLALYEDDLINALQ